MAGSLGLVAIAGLVGLALAGSSSSNSTVGSSPAGGGGAGPKGPTIDLQTCEQAFAKLPDTPAPGGGPSLKAIVLTAMTATTITADQIETLAKTLDTAQASAPSTELKQALAVAAQCLRERALQLKSGTPVSPLPDAMSCDVAFTSLPPEVQTQIVNARKTADPSAIAAAASALNALAVVTADPALRTRLQVAAKCLTAGASSGVGGPAPICADGVCTRADGGPPRKGIASNPAFQWNHVVQAGDNANLIAAKIFSTAGVTETRVRELILNNPTELNGRNLGPIRSDWAPGTPGQTPGVLNWTSLHAGDRLRVPKSWNAWIDEQGFRRGQASPFPSA